MQVVLRFEDYDNIEVYLDDQSKGFLKPLNQVINSRVKREAETALTSSIPSGGQLFEMGTGSST